MLVDPMAQAMSSEKLYAALDSNVWNLEQPIESFMKKRAKQAQRRKTPMDEIEHEVIEAHKEAQCVRSAKF